MDFIKVTTSGKNKKSGVYVSADNAPDRKETISEWVEEQKKKAETLREAQNEARLWL